MFLSGGEVGPLHRVSNMSPKIKAMLVMAQERRITLLAILESCGIEVLPVCDCNEARRMLETQSPVQAVVTDSALRDGDWRRVLEIVLQERPNVEVIVCSRLGDYNLWIDVLEQGGYDVLVEPYQHEEVRRIVKVAAARMRSPAQAIEPQNQGSTFRRS
jgi:DNA-binding NtrC family response regulator